MNYYCYNNGKITRKSDIRVGINDLVMLRGYGAFDYMRTYNGVPFRIGDYLDRFENSAKGMRLKVPMRRKNIIATVKTLLRKNTIDAKKDVGIRLLLTGGYSLDSYLPAVKANLFILIEDLPKYPDWWSEKGIKLMLHEHAREMARVKTTNYLTAIRLAEARRKANAQDTLYHSGGKILETTRNNFFLFHGDTLVTSKDDVLHGITRKTVLELAQKKFNVQVRGITVNELTRCTECFISGTTRGITPVVRIGTRKVGNGKPGKNTKAMMQAFAALVAKESKG